VQGATTIELTSEQLKQASSSSLWIQGGLPDDPILQTLFPEQYAFGALRCATDNVNGDNVEYIRFPSGSRHVYCFAYYVTPPPTSGTIVVEKAIDGADGVGGTFTFEGNISYTEDHRFSLNATSGNPARRPSTGPRRGPARPPGPCVSWSPRDGGSRAWSAPRAAVRSSRTRPPRRWRSPCSPATP
jgi:hypothetical protein